MQNRGEPERVAQLSQHSLLLDPAPDRECGHLPILRDEEVDAEDAYEDRKQPGGQAARCKARMLAPQPIPEAARTHLLKRIAKRPEWRCDIAGEYTQHHWASSPYSPNWKHIFYCSRLKEACKCVVQHRPCWARGRSSARCVACNR
jgi:hypothetical protein